MKVLVDTNILVYAVKEKLDLFSRLKEKFGATTIVIPSIVRHELKKLTTEAKKGADKRAAKLALQLIDFLKISELEISGEGDSAILEWAKKNKATVATNDLQFRRELKKEGIPCLYLKQKRLLRG